MPRTTTVTQFLERVSLPLADPRQKRYTPEAKVTYATEGLRAIRRNRPDMFMSNLLGDLRCPDPQDDENVVALMPLDDEYIQPLVDYTVARCQMADHDGATQALADKHLKLMIQSLG